jgi:hypothetical protein
MLVLRRELLDLLRYVLCGFKTVARGFSPALAGLKACAT